MGGRVAQIRKGTSMKKAEMIERLEKLQKLLSMDAQDVAEQVNAKHPNWTYKFDSSDAYPYMVGYAQEEIKYILNN